MDFFSGVRLGIIKCTPRQASCSGVVDKHKLDFVFLVFVCVCVVHAHMHTCVHIHVFDLF